MSIVSQNKEEVVIDLLALIRLLIRKLHIIIFCTLLVGMLFYAGNLFLVTPQYEANTTLYVNNSSSQDTSTAITASDLSASAQLVDTYSAIISSNTVLSQVISKADVDLTEEELLKQISISAVNDTEVFKVSVRNPDPKAAARIANGIAAIAPDQISEIVEGSSVKVVDYARIPTEIASPNYALWAILGMMMGFAVSIAVIVVRALLDRTIKSESDFERWTLPILGTVPDLEQANKTAAYGYGYGYAAAHRSRGKK